MAKREKKVIITGVTRECADEAMKRLHPTPKQMRKAQKLLQTLNCNVQKSEKSMPHGWPNWKRRRQRLLKFCRPLPPKIRQNCSPKGKALKWRMA